MDSVSHDALTNMIRFYTLWFMILTSYLEYKERCKLLALTSCGLPTSLHSNLYLIALLFFFWFLNMILPFVLFQEVRIPH
ncbi:transmembrane protein, putative [Medicago truncatula]|uniref:Transmembrane protein, putative n=1 Tax=Medicago truncatula TaxID=3880 RepID=A0A072VBN7_MEDTR|nr:transmembrane protein, putative [Medicago truncatula]